MPTNNWLAAARKENRKPVVYASIRDNSQPENTYGPAGSTDGTWGGSATLTNVSATEISGSAYPLFTGTTSASMSWVSISGGEYQLRYSFSPASYDKFLEELRHNTLTLELFVGGGSPPNNDLDVDVGVRIRSGSHSGTILYDGALVSRAFNTSYVRGSQEQGDQVYKYTMQGGAKVDTFNLDISGGTSIYVQVRVINLASAGNVQAPFVSSRSFEGVPQNSTNCTLTTSTIDMGATPTNKVTFSVNDNIDPDASIVYTALGGNSDPPATSLGTISDGDALEQYRYYRITAGFNSTEGGRGILNKIVLQEATFKYVGTHIDNPLPGVNPVLQVEKLQSLTAKIDLEKGVSTTAEFKLPLLYNKTGFVSDLLASRFLRGTDIAVYYGFEGLAATDFEPIFTGTWFDYEFDGNDGTMVVKARDVLKQFEGVQLPIVTYDANGDKSPANQDIVYTKQNIITVIKDIFDKIGIRDRYIPTQYETLEDDILTSTDYNVTRTLYDDSPIDSKKLLDELGQTINLFMVPRGNGTLYPVLYDEDAESVGTIDVNNFKPGQVMGNYEEIKTRFYSYFNVASSTNADPNQVDEFNKAYLLVNNTAENKWGNELKPKQFFDKWRIGNNETNPLTTGISSPPQALIDASNVWDSWFSDPKFSVTIKGMPPRWFEIDPGEIVEVNNLIVPVARDEWDSGTTYGASDRIIYSGRMYESLQDSNLNQQPDTATTYWKDLCILSTGLTDCMRFIVLKKMFNLRSGTVDLTIRQI